MRLVPGHMIASKYRVVRLLGAGGFGEVYEVEHAKLDLRFALKMLSRKHTRDPELVSRFEREARAAARLRNEYITRVTDVDTEAGIPYMVMELLDGHDLDNELGIRGRLPIVEAAHWLRQACSAVGEAHAQGIVHRDLKPANLYLHYEREKRILKVLDFGISKLVDDQDANLTTTSSSFGTPLYMSPEQIRSAREVDSRADIWSMGVILYACLTGEVPFRGESANAVIASVMVDKPPPIADIPKALSDIVMSMLHKDPEGRPQTVADVAELLAPFDADKSPLYVPKALVDSPNKTAPETAEALTIPDRIRYQLEPTQDAGSTTADSATPDSATPDSATPDSATAGSATETELNVSRTGRERGSARRRAPVLLAVGVIAITTAAISAMVIRPAKVADSASSPSHPSSAPAASAEPLPPASPPSSWKIGAPAASAHRPSSQREADAGSAATTQHQEPSVERKEPQRAKPSTTPQPKPKHEPAPQPRSAPTANSPPAQTSPSPPSAEESNPVRL